TLCSTKTVVPIKSLTKIWFKGLQQCLYAVRGKVILIPDLQSYRPAGYLLLGKLHVQRFACRERCFFQDIDIPVGTLERSMWIELPNRLYLDGLDVGSLGDLPVLDLKSHLVDIVCKIGGIAVGNVQEHKVAYRVDVVEFCTYAVVARLADGCGVAF